MSHHFNIIPPASSYSSPFCFSCLCCLFQSQPLFELRCSNNVVHLHTCADSCASLVNLLQYLVSQGDLHPPPRQNSPTEIAGQKLPVSVTCSRQSFSPSGLEIHILLYIAFAAYSSCLNVLPEAFQQICKRCLTSKCLKTTDV